MPRIAAALGGLVLIVFSIGFNTVRYPKVREMVGPASPLAQPDQSPESTVTAGPVSTAPSRVPDKASSSSQSISDASRRGDAKGAEETELCLNSPAGACPVDPVSYSNADARWSEEPSESSSEYGGDVAMTGASVRPEADGGLVPLVRPAEERDPHEQPADDGETRRLPPVDPEDPVAEDPYVRRSAGDPIPFYPSTGYE
ncbi:MAG TPA: hypothetical protein VMY42_19705 [Thermoguttaceae bacterium]|nr:hypothetical protein [Thermoguttaceae bacterium]